MDFHAHRPQRGFGRSERTLAKIAEDLTRFLTKAQRSLTYDTLHLPVAPVRPLRIFSWSSPKTCRRLLVSGAVLKRTISTSLGHHSPVCFSQTTSWTPNRSIPLVSNSSFGRSMPNWNLN